ncbi:MAG: SDR family oxidoreductase [Pseudomonadota bacterium]
MADRKIAVVTGAGGGIAAPLLPRLAAEGWGLHLTDISQEMLAPALAEARKHDPDATGVVSMLESVEACRAALPPSGAIHALVHLAGIFVPHSVSEQGRPVYERTMAANADNAFDLVAAADDRLADHARIVFISSLAFSAGSPEHPGYSMAKGALVGLTRALARSHAPRGILVNALAPGIIETGMPAHVIAKDGEAYRKRIPLGRFGAPEEVSGVIAFLLSPDAGYITGQTLRIDGGVTAG